jgi:hypothetical protein
VSFRVVTEVLERSRVEDSTNLSVLLAIAETAHHDGIAFLPQGPVDDSKSIAFRSRNSLRTVERSVADLEWNLEVEIRKAQRGRAPLEGYALSPNQLDHLGVRREHERTFVSARPTRETILADICAKTSGSDVRPTSGWSNVRSEGLLARSGSGTVPRTVLGPQPFKKRSL